MQLQKSLKQFLNSSTGPGMILIGCVVVSLIIANSPLGPAFESLLATELGYHADWIHLKYPVLLWVNDGLMALFFLMVGLEIKKELVKGHLSSPKSAALPVLAAIGGVAAPALLYVFFNAGTDTAGGWAIPMATDIAFALAIVMMLGKKVPMSLKIFLAALAIVDDLIAIMVIAIFYASDLNATYLLYAAGIFVMLLAFNKLGVRNLAFYLIPGAFIWYFIHHSGVHATIAGVMTAFTIPVTMRKSEKQAPLDRLEHALAQPVNLMIMPLFALVNTNIAFESSMIQGLLTPLGLGIILGLVVGKPLGIFLITWVSVRTGLCSMPDKASLGHILGVGMLAGIGFTMSIFIAVLSFTGQEHLMSTAKFSVLLASLISALCGSLYLTYLDRKAA